MSDADMAVIIILTLTGLSILLLLFSIRKKSFKEYKERKVNPGPKPQPCTESELLEDRAGYYKIDVICGNCGHTEGSYVKKGIMVGLCKCPKCGTISLKRNKDPKKIWSVKNESNIKE